MENLRTGRITPKQFVPFFRSSIEALESIPYTTITKARNLEYKIEVAGFAEEDENISDLATVVEEVRKFIREINR